MSVSELGLYGVVEKEVAKMHRIGEVKVIFELLKRFQDNTAK